MAAQVPCHEGEGPRVALVLEMVDQALGDTVGVATAVEGEVDQPTGGILGGLSRGLGQGGLPGYAAEGAEGLLLGRAGVEQIRAGGATGRKEESAEGGKRFPWVHGGAPFSY